MNKPCMTYAASQAMTHWVTTVAQAFRLPISRRTVAMAATHGVYSSVKIRNTVAVIGVNIAFRLSVSPPSKTVSVETTVSLAANPVSSAVAARQSAKPSGAKSGAAKRPIEASRLSSGAAATFRWPSNICRDQIKIEAAKITENDESVVNYVGKPDTDNTEDLIEVDFVAAQPDEPEGN